MKIVISQPMFFPWVGMFEQIRLADVYVHYDDVQFSKGSLVNRIQVKTPDGFKWLTVPLDNLRLGQQIKEVKLETRRDWRRQHLDFLAQVYAPAPYKDEMLDLVKSVYSKEAATIAEVAIASIQEVCAYFDFERPGKFLLSSTLGIPGRGSQRVLDIVKQLGGDIYITGHGARSYLEHEKFEAEGVRVEYIDYRKTPYPQLYGEFNPYVSILDLIANMGARGRDVIASDTVYWKDFIS